MADERAASRNGSMVRTEILLVVGLGAFVAVAYALERVFSPDQPVRLGAWGPLPSLALSVVPALLWLAYFYLQDRHEPEPKMFVLGVYLLGAFVAVPLSRLFLTLVPLPSAPAWASGRLSPVHVLLAIVPLGLAQEFAKYVVVRYSIYLSDEFDEPMDGIVYMTAAGIGFATTENYQYLAGLDHTVFLATGAMNCVVTTLAHGCIAGVLGYALGVARFTPPAGRRFAILVGGLLAAAVLNGLFNLLEAAVTVDGMHVAPWRGVAFAAGFAALVFGATYLLMRRHLAASPLAPPAEEGAHGN